MDSGAVLEHLWGFLDGRMLAAHGAAEEAYFDVWAYLRELVDDGD